jgi:hypothetical protein
MAELSPSERLGEVAALRAKVKSNASALSRLHTAITDALSSVGITIDPRIGNNIIIALPEEISDNLNNVILPGGTNCA